MDLPEPPFDDAAARDDRLSDETALALQEALGGRYVLQRELGRGGMGIVYLAWDFTLQRWVALKILPPAIATADRRERFLREARIAAGLAHDNIVPIHAVAHAGPFVYYTMAYVRGETLYERIRTEGPLPVGEVTRILHDVAGAVHYAHTHKVVHRDLKPHNILIEQSRGRPYVADFGIARVVSDRALPGTGRTFGTFTYMSPEQAAGLPVDHRSDIYSLGVLAYVMATGRPPFTGSVRDVLEQHVFTAAPPLPVMSVHGDTTLARAVARCLAKDPRERFRSAEELAEALLLAPELRADVAEPVRRFLDRLRLESDRVGWGIVLLGLPALGALAIALEGEGSGSVALAVVALLLAAPVLSLLPATRRLLRERHDRADIVHALGVEVDRQLKQLGGGASGVTANVAWGVIWGAAGVYFLGFLAALSGVDLPEGAVIGGIVVGMLTLPLAGVVVLVADRRGNAVWGKGWRRFWESRFGAWMVKIAGIGLPRVRSEAEKRLADRSVTALPAAAEPEDAAASAPPLSALEAFHDEVYQTETSVRRARVVLDASAVSAARDGGTSSPEQAASVQSLERHLVTMEALLAKFRAADVAAVEAGSLTADLETVREVREVVDGLVEGWGWRG